MVVWPASDLPNSWSVTIVWVCGVVGTLGVAGLAVVLWRYYLAEAARAAAALDPSARLVEGPAIVAGRVEHAEGRATAVRAEITQEGSENESSGSWSHKWVEFDRRVEVAPFYLRRSDGERIRVEPDPEVFLVDDMDGCILVDRARRIRVAELVPDEHVIARGTLQRDLDPEARSQAYRDSPTGWVLRPSRRGDMHLSSEPLEARFLRKARFHRNAAFIVAGITLLTHLVLLNFHRRYWSGTTEVATVTDKRTYITTDSDGDDTTHYQVRARAPWGADVVDDVSVHDYGRVDVGDRVAIVHVDRELAQLGSGASMHVALCLGLAGGLVWMVALYGFAARRARPWYAPGVKVKDTGSGRLDPRTGLEPDVPLERRDGT